MHISLVGVNLLNLPLSLREKLAISPSKLPESLLALKRVTRYGVVLSTCNRVEVYTADNSIEQASKTAMEFFRKRLSRGNGKPISEMYILEDKAAILHLFRVACSLESIIIGECEILGQVKSALFNARRNNMANFALEYIFQNALRIGKLIREKTSISKNALSISSLALNLAEKISGDLKDCKLLIIGAGEAGTLVAKIAVSREVTQLVIANRTLQRAKKLTAKIGGIPVGHNRVMEHLVDTNVLITCSGAPHKTLDFERVNKIMTLRPHTPLVIVDIGVPQNIDSGVGSIENVFLYHIDDLIELSETNRIQRENEVHKVERLISEEMRRFSLRWKSLLAEPLLKGIVNKNEAIRSAQVRKSFKKLSSLTFEEQIEIEAMTRSIVSKILHPSLAFLKNNNSDSCHEIVEELFQLDNR